MENYCVGYDCVISTHTPLAGRDKAILRSLPSRFISTHTPLAGRDSNIPNGVLQTSISTHTPLAGRDGAAVTTDESGVISTHTPLAGRDRFGQYTAYTVRDFYSHAPCGARPQNLVIHLAATSIS